MSDSTGNLTAKQLLQMEIPPADEIYDRIMDDIEPDLVTANLPEIDSKYEGETDKEKKTRYKRYEAAFAEYEKRFKEWMAHLKRQFEQARKKLVKKAEAKSASQEAEKLEELEDMFASA